MNAISPLFYLTLIPLVAALFIMAGSAARFTARVSSILMLVLTLWLCFAYRIGEGGYQFASSFPVAEDIGLHLSFGADGLSLAMLLLASIVTVSAVWVIPAMPERENLFTACVLLISAGVAGAFSSTDVLFFYAFHEVALIPTFLLIGIWGSGDRQAAAWKATIYLGLASFVLLIGIIGLYLSGPEGARSFDMVTLQDWASTGLLSPPDWVYLTLLFGFGTLVSLFPLHSWAPQAYASAPTPASMLHAGVLKKFGLYGMLRIVTPIFPEAMQTYLNLLLVLLAGNILYIGLVTIAQKRLDWMLGYSSVMHMGYIFLGIAGLSALSLSGAAVLMVAHGLSIAALFALCGVLRERTGTLEFSELGGIGKSMPMLGLLFGFAAMASIGLPGFANFPGEIMIFFGAIGASGGLQPGFALNGLQITTIIAVWGVVISAVYMLRAYRRIFFGTMSERWSGLADISPIARYAVVLLVVALMVIGFYPQLLLQFVTPSLLLP